MNKLKLDWQRVASVTPGGKPYFWIAFLVNADKARAKFSVVWDRARLQWLAEMDNMSNGDHKFIGWFFHHKAARDHVETIANEMTASLKAL